MAQERGGNIICRHLRPPDFPALGAGVLHARTDALADDPQLQLRKDARHLNKRICHGIDLSAGAVHVDAADDAQSQHVPFAALILRARVILLGV